MRQPLRLLAIALVVLACSTSALAATTAEQLVELSRAGLGDDILIELIQSDGSTFQLAAADLLALHQQGLSDRVIRAMQATAKKKPAPAPVVVTPVEPQRSDPWHVSPRPQEPPVVNVYQTVTQTVEAPSRHEPAPQYSVPIAVPVYLPAPVQPRPAPPVYWGWNGQRRPDSWDDRDRGRPPEPVKPEPVKKGGN